MPRINHELRLFCLAIGLPALFVVAGGIRLLCIGWRANWTEAQDDLKLQAAAYVDSLIAEAERQGFHHGPPNAPRRPKPSPRPHAPRPPNAPPHRWGRGLLENLPEICEAVCANQKGLRDQSAFAVCDEDGAVLYATPDYPNASTIMAEAHLPPPFGRGFLRTAPADGGAAVRAHAVRILALGAVMLLLLVCTLSAGGILLVYGLRRERRDARRKADFIDNVSHELKTPLAGIRLNAELLAGGRIPGEDLRRGALEAIIVESDRLGRMVDELLDFRRLEKGTRRYRIETFDLAAFLLDPAELQAAAGASQGRASVRAAGPSATVAADKDAIRQIGAILLSNALKYAGDGPVEIETEGPRIHCMDRGPGIPRGDEERIFERGQRGDSTLSAATSGSGLGLAIARGLARGMGGDLTCARRPGGGSTFTLHLKEA